MFETQYNELRAVFQEKRLEVIFEFLIFGVVIGVIEDLLTVYFTSGESITSTTVFIVVCIALLFAVLGELVADNIDFIKIYKRLIGKGNVRQQHE